MQFKTYRKFLYIPALIFISAGLVAGFVSGQWSPVPIALASIGIIILIAWLFLALPRGFWQKRSTRAGTHTLITTLIVLALVGLINFLATRDPVRVDFTEKQLYSLSPQTDRLLADLQQPVKVFIFSKGGNDPNEEELLTNYRRENSRFEYEFIDPEKKPNIAGEFKKLSDNILYRAYLQYGDKKQPIKTLVEGETLTEAKLSNAIETIRSNRTLTAYFLQGHGEPEIGKPEGGLVQAVNNLESKGYKVEPLNLVQRSGIPDNADVIIIAGPTRKLFPQEVTALKNYADKGGKLFLLLDPQTDAGLDDLLKEWGVKLDKRLIIDGSGAGRLLELGPASPIITDYGNHPITRDFGNGISIFPNARPIATVPVDGVEAVSLLITNEKMWAESDLSSPTLQFDAGRDVPGPFDLGVALTRTAKPPKKDSKLIVIGNSTFALDGFFQEQLNGDIFLNSVAWLTAGDNATLSIRPKKPENRRLNLTPLQANAVFWISIVFMPLLGFTLAGVTWWRRR
ncbi:Gldg family protein [Pannus brasiliensis CCIBt3594]|uniref:Gldg family protein n=1 Tax=Pannus brasiliensis CCIBt3594 TaxID=1427578 RepID=A0AAW9QIV6_9CHRO